MVAAGRPWAKSGDGAWGRLEFAGGVWFRHELASLLLIDGPLGRLLAAAPDPDLCRYLVLAHHGRLRTRISDWKEAPDQGEGAALGSSGVCGAPANLGTPPARVILGLEQGVTSDLPP